MLVQWTALQPSLRARRWRQVGLGIGVATTVALAAAAVVAVRFDAGIMTLALLAAVAVAVALRAQTEPQLEVGVASTGEIQLRESGADQTDQSGPSNVPIRVVFAAPWLISMRRGTMLISIWPDSLPSSVFRQLWVHLRWGRAVPKGEDQPSIGGGQ